MGLYQEEWIRTREALALQPKRVAESFERVQAELAFAHQLCSAHPEHAAGWRERVLEAARLIRSALFDEMRDPASLTAEVETLLAPLSEVAKAYRILCVGHAHIDMNWQWSWPETVGLTHDTFETMLALMDEVPEFIFSQSQASVYAAMEKYDPPMFERIRERVRQGRWEVTASQWVEGDKNLASGESINRHLLYTRAYFRDKFGLEPEDVPIDFEPDTFGHPASLPTILARGAVRYYYHCRGSRGPHLYWWIGPDGSRLLVLNDVQWYMHFDEQRQVAVGANLADPLMDFAAATGLKLMPVLYGVGDHGGGPTRKDLRKLIAMDSWPIYPRVSFSTLRHFFETAEAEAGNLPEISEERNFIFAGCYTSQARQKEANRHGENLLYAAEVAAVLGDRLAGVPYPRENLEEAWRYLLFDQFHDILPGSGVRATRHYTLGKAQETQAMAGIARTNALRGVSRRINTEALVASFRDEGPLRAYKDEVEAGVALGAGVGNATGTGGESAFSMTRTSDRAYLIFNSLAVARTEVVRAKLWDTALNPELLVVTGEDMAPEPVQILGTGHYAGHGFLEVAFPVTVPPLGYRAVCISDRRIEMGLPAPEPINQWDGVGGAGRLRMPADTVMENEAFRVQLDPASGSLVSLLDKRTGREFVPPGEHLGLLQMYLEANVGMSAWVIGPFKRREDLIDGGELTRLHAGPHVEAFRWTRRVGKTRLELDISLARGVERIDFELRVDWREVGDRETGTPNLRVRFPMDLDGTQGLVARYEIPSASLRRDLFQGEEVPAQRWVDLADADGVGMTLANASRYGFSVEGTALTMTLLRASSEPDPLPDLGEHVIRYALVPHGADWSEGACMAVGETMNVPLSVTSCAVHPGDLPTVHSFISVEPENVRLTSVKKAQDGSGMILRLVEVAGVECEAHVTVAPELLGEAPAALEMDTLERPVEPNAARLKDGDVVVSLNAYATQTVSITMGNN